MAIVIPNMHIRMVENWNRELERERDRELERERCLFDIGAEAVSLISARVFYMNFGMFKSFWRTLHLNSPCLMFSQNSSNSWKVFHSLYNEFHVFDFPELEGAEIEYSKDGWLLMSDHECHLFFFNPSTRVKFVLPPISSSFISVCFTSGPTSLDCCVFGLLDGSTGFNFEYGFIRFGEDEWEVGQWGSRHLFWIPNWPPLFYNGMYYLLDSRATNIKRFDPTKENEDSWKHFGILHEGNRQINFEPNFETNDDDDDDDDDDEEEEDDGDEEEDEDDEANDDDFEEEEEEEEEDDEENDDNEEEEEEDDEEEEFHEIYMVEVDGEIWAIFLKNKTGLLHVKKLDLLEMRWRKLDSLGDKCLYLSRKGSFVEGCLGSDMANKIYFDRFYGKNGVMYCMSSNMYHSVGGDYASKEVAGSTTSTEVYGPGLTQPYNGTWIKLNRN